MLSTCTTATITSFLLAHPPLLAARPTSQSFRKPQRYFFLGLFFVSTGMQCIPRYTFRIFSSQRAALSVPWHRRSDDLSPHVNNILATPYHNDRGRTQHVLNQTWKEIVGGHFSIVIFHLLLTRYQHLHGHQRVSLAFECRYRFADQIPLDAIRFDENARSFDITSMIAAAVV